MERLRESEGEDLTGWLEGRAKKDLVKVEQRSSHSNRTHSLGWSVGHTGMSMISYSLLQSLRRRGGEGCEIKGERGATNRAKDERSGKNKAVLCVQRQGESRGSDLGQQRQREMNARAPHIGRVGC